MSERDMAEGLTAELLGVEASLTQASERLERAVHIAAAIAALPATPPASETVEAARVAQWFHEAYERLAPSFGYETREASAVPWADVPEPNRSLMVAVAGEVLSKEAAIRAESGGLDVIVRAMLEHESSHPWTRHWRCVRTEDIEALRARLAEDADKE